MRIDKTTGQNKHCPMHKGSALLATLLTSSVVFVVLAAFLPSTMTQVKSQLKNNQYKIASMLSEAGLEEAVWAFNNHTTLSNWTNDGWSETSDSNFLYKEIDMATETFQLAYPYAGTVEVTIRNPFEHTLGTTLEIVSRAKITNTETNKQAIRKVLTLNTQVRTPFRGFLAINNLVVTGTPQFNSFNSSNTPATYDAVLNSTDNVKIGSLSKAVDSIQLIGAVINGDVVSGAFDPMGDKAVNMDTDSSVSGKVVSGFSMEMPPPANPDTTGFLTSF